MQAIEGALPEALAALPPASLDVVMIVSVLEHVREPQRLLAEAHRLLAPGGVALVNVPSWRGKKYLELSAFRLGLSPAAEMDDHKMYYDVKDLWPLLVAAGFRPSRITCFSHKLGLNTFAVCRTRAERRRAGAQRRAISTGAAASVRRGPGLQAPVRSSVPGRFR